MRQIAIALIAALAAALPGGCVLGAGDERPACHDDRDFPRCTLGGTALLTCSAGLQHIQQCAANQRCLEILDDAGLRFSQCVHQDATICDVETFEPVCANERTLNNCRAPLGHLEAGHTFLDPCSEGTVCISGWFHDVCATPGAEACDPEAYAGVCDDERPVFCHPQGGVTLREPACAAPLVCQVGARGAVCADPDAEACVWENYRERCEGDAVMRCDYYEGFTELDPCEAGERCRESSTSAECFGAERPDCDSEIFETRCEGDERVICSSGFGVEQRQTCGDDQACRVSGAGAHCVDPDAEVCDPSGFVPYCSGNRQVLCSYFSGFTFEIACTLDQTCRMSDLGGSCVDQDATICDPETFLGTCNGDTARFCNFFTGFTDTETCLPAEACAADETCVLGFCQHLAMCVDRALPGCSEPAGISCRGRTVVSCFDGHEMTFDCAEDQLCATDDGATFRCE